VQIFEAPGEDLIKQASNLFALTGLNEFLVIRNYDSLSLGSGLFRTDASHEGEKFLRRDAR
jgi:hypothetical protein